MILWQTDDSGGGNVDRNSVLSDWFDDRGECGAVFLRHVQRCEASRRRANRIRAAKKAISYLGQVAIQGLLGLLCLLTIYACYLFSVSILG